jgi:hypothetical protein
MTEDGNFPRPTPVRDLHMALKLPYIYDYITKLCRQQAEVIQNHENANVRNIGQGELRHRKYKRLKLDGGQAYDRSNDIYYCLTITVLFLWGALSDGRTGMSFIYAAGPRQRSLSRVRFP